MKIKKVFTGLVTGFLFTMPAQAASLRIGPAAPQPGDVLTLTLIPSAGEIIQSVRMSAFDTATVKFYPRSNGSLRAYLGYPFDRKGGKFTLTATAEVTRGDAIEQQQLRAAFTGRTRDFPTQHITMQGSTAQKMYEKAALHREKQFVQSAMRDSYGEPLWQGAWILPAHGESTSSYGRRRYVNGKWWGQHNGADIKASSGTPVLATNSGRVVLSHYLPMLRGNCIVVDHGCNVFSIYMHLSQRLVRVGDSVGKGQLIGRVGATGFVTGPHLHWEMRIGWEPVDPFHVVRNGLSF